MNVSSVTTFGSAAIASPPAGETANASPDKKPEPASAQPTIEAAKEPGTGQHVDIKV